MDHSEFIEDELPPAELNYQFTTGQQLCGNLSKYSSKNDKSSTVTSSSTQPPSCQSSSTHQSPSYQSSSSHNPTSFKTPVTTGSVIFGDQKWLKSFKNRTHQLASDQKIGLKNNEIEFNLVVESKLNRWWTDNCTKESKDGEKENGVEEKESYNSGTANERVGEKGEADKKDGMGEKKDVGGKTRRKKRKDGGKKKPVKGGYGGKGSKERTIAQGRERKSEVSRAGIVKVEEASGRENGREDEGWMERLEEEEEGESEKKQKLDRIEEQDENGEIEKRDSFLPKKEQNIISEMHLINQGTSLARKPAELYLNDNNWDKNIMKSMCNRDRAMKKAKQCLFCQVSDSDETTTVSDESQGCKCAGKGSHALDNTSNDKIADEIVLKQLTCKSHNAVDSILGKQKNFNYPPVSILQDQQKILASEQNQAGKIVSGKLENSTKTQNKINSSGLRNQKKSTLKKFDEQTYNIYGVGSDYDASTYLKPKRDGSSEVSKYTPEKTKIELQRMKVLEELKRRHLELANSTQLLTGSNGINRDECSSDSLYTKDSSKRNNIHKHFEENVEFLKDSHYKFEKNSDDKLDYLTRKHHFHEDENLFNRRPDFHNDRGDYQPRKDYLYCEGQMENERLEEIKYKNHDEDDSLNGNHNDRGDFPYKENFVRDRINFDENKPNLKTKPHDKDNDILDNRTGLNHKNRNFHTGRGIEKQDSDLYDKTRDFDDNEHFYDDESNLHGSHGTEDGFHGEPLNFPNRNCNFQGTLQSSSTETQNSTNTNSKLKNPLNNQDLVSSSDQNSQILQQIIALNQDSENGTIMSLNRELNIQEGSQIIQAYHTSTCSSVTIGYSCKKGCYRRKETWTQEYDDDGRSYSSKNDGRCCCDEEDDSEDKTLKKQPEVTVMPNDKHFMKPSEPKKRPGVPGRRRKHFGIRLGFSYDVPNRFCAGKPDAKKEKAEEERCKCSLEFPDKFTKPSDKERTLEIKTFSSADDSTSKELPTLKRMTSDEEKAGRQKSPVQFPDQKGQVDADNDAYLQIVDPHKKVSEWLTPDSSQFGQNNEDTLSKEGSTKFSFLNENPPMPSECVFLGSQISEAEEIESTALDDGRVEETPKKPKYILKRSQSNPDIIYIYKTTCEDPSCAAQQECVKIYTKQDSFEVHGDYMHLSNFEPLGKDVFESVFDWLNPCRFFN